MNVLITAPPMLRMFDHFAPVFKSKNIEMTTPKVIQTLSVGELIRLVPHHDGWIVGDDPVNKEVLEAGKKGKLKAVVKWGVGVDNIDFDSAKSLNIPIKNTPGMFGGEVADVAMSYIIALARETFWIDREIRSGQWPKPTGISLSGKTVALVGFGNIGKNLARRLSAAEMKIIAYDPYYTSEKKLENAVQAHWPERVDEADFIVFVCALTPQNRHMLNEKILQNVKPGVRIVNVSRGGLIDEKALLNALDAGRVHSAALDVFETEPLPLDSSLRKFDKCIFGSHNSSNTKEAVIRTSEQATKQLFDFLGVH